MLLGKSIFQNQLIIMTWQKAYNFFVDAANKGDSKSQLMIGRFFLMGEIVDKDYEKVMHYF